MAEEKQLTKDQKDRIDTTLKRIRAGLKRTETSSFEEPAHLFKPEANNEKP